MQCLELIYYRMATLCFIVSQPSVFVAIKKLTLALNISGVTNATVTHEILLNTCFFFALSNDNSIIIL